MKGKATSTPTKVQKQKEEAAALAASKLMTPKESTPGATPEPTLQERLEAIDRRAKERAAEEKQQLAHKYLVDARAEFQRAVSKSDDEEVKTAYETWQQMEKLAGGSHGAGATSEKGSKGTKRSKDQLKVDADALVAYLEKHPNSKAADLKAIADFGLSLSKFVEKYAGRKVHKEGSLSNMTYSLK